MKFLRYLTVAFTLAVMAGCADLSTNPMPSSDDDRGYIGSGG